MPSATFRLRSEDLAWRTFDEETVLVDAVRGRVHCCSPSASALVLALGAGAGEDELVHALGARYAIDEARARADVRALLARLIAEGVVAEETSAAASVGAERSGEHRAPPVASPGVTPPAPPPACGAYVAPVVDSHELCCFAAGCGKSEPFRESCIQVPSNS